MNVLIAGKTSEICDSIAGLLIDLDCDNISTFTSGAIVRGVDISRFDSVIISTPLSDEFGLDLVADIAKENRQLSQQLSDMKIVNRAKSMLMQYLNLTEEQAHRHIQKQAMDLRKTQRAVAEDILKTYQNTKEEE